VEVEVLVIPCKELGIGGTTGGVLPVLVDVDVVVVVEFVLLSDGEGKRVCWALPPVCAAVSHGFGRGCDIF
jgi:hypothetical protein